MENKKNNLKYLLIILLTSLFIVGISFIFMKNEILNKIGSFLSSASLTVGISLYLIFKIEFNINKTINKRIEINNNQINLLNNQLNIIKNNCVNINENYFNQSFKQIDNPDDKLYEEMKKLYEPIEEFLVLNGGFGASFYNKPFLDLVCFADFCTLSRYDFINKDLQDIHEKLKISTIEFANIFIMYTYPLENNLGMSKFKYLDIMKEISYRPEANTKNEIEENKQKYDRANELLKEIVKLYKELDKKYKTINFDKK